MSKKMFIRQAGNTLLNTPLLNKGSAFTLEERNNFNLMDYYQLLLKPLMSK